MSSGPSALSETFLPDPPYGWQVVRIKGKLPKAAKGQPYYYMNKTTRATTFLPPPPNEELCIISDTNSYYSSDDKSMEGADAVDTSNGAAGTLFGFIAKAPTQSAEDAMADGVELAPTQISSSGLKDVTAATDNEKTKTAIEHTFTVKYPLKLKKKELVEKAKALSIQTDGRLKDEIALDIEKYFMDLHKKEGTNYLSSDCFKAKKQVIDRQRKESSSAKRKKAFAKNQASAGNIKVNAKKSKKKELSFKDVLVRFPGHHFYMDENGKLCCPCDNKLKHGDAGAFQRHCNSEKHKKILTAVTNKEKREIILDKMRASKQEEEKIRLELAGTRSSSVLEGDKSYRREAVENFLAAGIPIHKADKLRKWLENNANKSLLPGKELFQNHVNDVLYVEEEVQTDELKDKCLGLIQDATPRQGDVFASISCYVCKDPEARTAWVSQKLMRTSFIQGNLNGGTLSCEISLSLTERRKKPSDVKVVNSDLCSTNTAAYNIIERATNVDWLKSFCLSYCASNAGDELCFVILDLFWSLLQKVFAHSDAAKTEWFSVTGQAFPSHSDICWYSQYEVYEIIFPLFPDLVTAVTRITSKGIAPVNSAKLLKLTDDVKSWYVKIELSATVEALAEVWNFCYQNEGDGQEVFNAGKSIGVLLEKFPLGQMCALPSTSRLIMRAINWANEQGIEPPQPPPPRRTIREVTAQVQNRPRRAASAGVQAAVQAGETDAQRRRREAREAAAQAQAHAEYEAARQAAIEAEADALAGNIPLTPNAWTAHITSGVAPVIHYLFSCLNDPSGDRFMIVEFFKGARIFDPLYAATLTTVEAHALIDKLSNYPCLCKGTIIRDLKAGWCAYKKKAERVQDKVDILDWHYKQFLGLDEEVNEDKRESLCRYCSCITNRCHCNKGMHQYWEACSLVVLVQPSSAAAERVFSLLKNMWSEQQTHAMSDVIKTSLFLAYNKRCS